MGASFKGELFTKGQKMRHGTDSIFKMVDGIGDSKGVFKTYEEAQAACSLPNRFVAEVDPSCSDYDQCFQILVDAGEIFDERNIVSRFGRFGVLFDTPDRFWVVDTENVDSLPIFGVEGSNLHYVFRIAHGVARAYHKDRRGH